MKYGTNDRRQFWKEQNRSFRWRYIKQDDQEKHRNTKIEFLAGAYTNRIAENAAWKKKLTNPVQGKR